MNDIYPCTVMKSFSVGATDCVSDIPDSVHRLSFFNFLSSGHSFLYVSFEFDLMNTDIFANLDRFFSAVFN